MGERHPQGEAAGPTRCCSFWPPARATSGSCRRLLFPVLCRCNASLDLYPTCCSRAALEQAARAAVAADNSWWRLDAVASLPNLRHAASPKAFKSAIVAAAEANQLVLVDYFKPSCHACRTLAPKLKQLAEQNSDVLVLQVGARGRELMVGARLAPGIRRLERAMRVHAAQWRCSLALGCYTITAAGLGRLVWGTLTRLSRSSRAPLPSPGQHRGARHAGAGGRHGR